MKEISISIIIPVYKVEKYIRECIESVIKQKNKNIEIILIDDGSPDDSGKICDEYALVDSRIKVIHKNNEGVSKTRNIGLEIAKGEYIMFLDSDDILCDNILNEIQKDIKSNLDLYTYTFKKIDNLSLEMNEMQNKEFSDGRYSKKEFMEEYYKQFRGFPWQVWQSVFKTDLIRKNKLKFDETKKAAEDVDFYITYLELAESVNYRNKSIIKYRVGRENSAMTALKKEAVENILDIYEKYAKSKNEFIAKCFSGFYIGAIIYCIKLKREEKNEIIEKVNIDIIKQAESTKANLFKVCIAILGKRNAINFLLLCAKWYYKYLETKRS